MDMKAPIITGYQKDELSADVQVTRTFGAAACFMRLLNFKNAFFQECAKSMAFSSSFKMRVEPANPILSTTDTDTSMSQA